jgi:chromosome segregation ATPase
MAKTLQETREAIERRTAEHRTRHDALGAEYAGLGGAETEAQQRGDAQRVLAVRQRGKELEDLTPLAKAAELEASADLEGFDARQYQDDPAALERVTRLRAEREQLDAEIRDEQATIDSGRRRRDNHLMSETEYRHKAKLIRENHQ